MQRIGVVLVQPVVAVEEEELLAPEHAGQGLAHHVGLVVTRRGRRDRLVKLIGFAKPISEDFIELLSEGFALLTRRILGKPKANHLGLTSTDIEPEVGCDLGALLLRIHYNLIALHHAVVDAILDVAAVVLLPREKAFVVGFILSEEQRHLAFTGKSEFTEHWMCNRDRTRACRRLGLSEVRLRGSSVRFGNPRRPIVAEPQRGQKMQIGCVRSPVGRCNPHQNVFRPGFGVLDEDVEVPVLIENAGVEELVLHVVSICAAGSSPPDRSREKPLCGYL